MPSGMYSIRRFSAVSSTASHWQYAGDSGRRSTITSSRAPRVHIIGVAYKRDVNDLRESPALEVLELLAHRGAIVSYTDPYVAAFKHASLDLQHVDEAIAHKGIDCGVIITDHKVFDYAAMIDRFPLLVDTRNALKGVTGPKIFRL